MVSVESVHVDPAKLGLQTLSHLLTGIFWEHALPGCTDLDLKQNKTNLDFLTSCNLVNLQETVWIYNSVLGQNDTHQPAACCINATFISTWENVEKESLYSMMWS